ncbi:MAG: proline dehydrogenase [Flavobacteriales bacterium]|nr:MAG: proline dehydrogenase [Flavobacteriales bacterium]
MKPDFNDTKVAFAVKSDSEIERAYFLFKLIKSEPLVKIGKVVTNFALKVHLPVENLIRATVFDHFCGGTNEKDCMSVIEKMYTKNVCAILDYSVEGKEIEDQFNLALEKTLQNIQFAKEKPSIPFAVFKPTGFGRFELYEKLSENKTLNNEEQIEWEKILFRYNTVCKAAYDNDVPLLIDAEESWIQKAIDDLVVNLMEKYNREKAIIFNTLQMYRWDRVDYLKKIQKRSKERNFVVGVKLVRGAYLEKERERAKKLNYKSPICATKAETDDNFNAGLAYMMQHDNLTLFMGTHNQESTSKLIQLMEDNGIQPNDKRIWFGQLYGMSDHISFNLAKAGYNVTKYLPYGPVRDVMPYLMRRAEENTSVAGQTNRELELLKIEKKRRNL